MTTIDPSNPETSLVGAQLGKYQVRAEIGHGGMGKVYKAYDPTLERYVALKVLAPHLTWEEEFVERFLREARAAAKLKHPNIVTIYDVGRTGGWYYFTMDFVEGNTLAQLIRDRGPMSVEDALRILRPLAGALDYAHEHGLVHRDVKPSNVVVSDEGLVTLMDFGIARASQATRLTRSGAVMGTPEYMAPEQATGAEVDRYTDQYALGVVAYEMLAGKAPFEAESTPTLLYRIVHEAPPPLRATRPDVPPAVSGALSRALSKDKEKRFANCGQFVDALDQGTRTVQAEAPSRAVPVLPEEEQPRKPKTTLLGLGGVGLVVVGLLCLAASAIAVVIGLLVFDGGGKASPDATDTPPPLVGSGTAPALTYSTATPAPATVTPLGATPVAATSSPAPQGPTVLFEDDFEAPWSGWEIGDYEQGSVGPKDGAYSVRCAGEQTWMWGVANLYFTDLIMEVDATQVTAGPENNNDYGVICRLQSDGDGYQMIVSGDGYYAIYLREEGTYTALVEFQQSGLVRRGDATNHIRAVCDGPSLSLYVNGSFLGSVEDTTFTAGDIAFTATSYEDAPTEILFDNLVVYEASD